MKGMMRKAWGALLAGSLVALAGCDNNGGGEKEVHFEYEGKNGPESWGSLKPEWATCGSGKEQSPIDLTTTAPPTNPKLVPDYAPSALTILNNGHTVQANYAPGSKLTVDGHEYALLQFHFHAESEHTVNGRHSPLEVHLVHKDSTGKLAVLGILIEEGAENLALKPVFDNLPAKKGEPQTIASATVDLADLLPENLSAWRYAGSLTTPPCSEQVSWQVLSTTVTASKAQIEKFTAIFENNARPAQALNARSVANAHFEYEGEDGPENWGELSSAWSLCGEGEAQSPIDIPAKTPGSSGPALETTYAAAPLNIVNNGHTVQVNYAAGNTLKVGDKTWELLQFHFHAGSEHTVAGKEYPLEMHLVHRDGSGGLAVVGVLIEEGDENAELAKVFDHLPATKGPAATVAGVSVNAANLLPPMPLASWRYNGSLTTPPCSEGVRWHLLSTPIQASAEQIEQFTALYEDDARPVQPLNGRSID